MESVLEVIESGKWKRALFTTYVFSLSFFESVLLRKLRQAGCQEIWVIADLHGYRMSLVERRSRAIGHEYRLIPIRIPNGIFHPKCAYLEGANDDALIIGSGNVTFGGFGRNLEVMEVFSSQSYGDLFLQFADFLAALRRRSDLECPNLTWAEVFESRSRSSGYLSNTRPGVRLLHSAQTPIVSQLATEITHVETLTVLSPFYDHDGDGVKTLADKLNCSKIRIGVPPNARATNFPFSAAKRWGHRVDPVWSEDADPKRTLHAKWFEFRSPIQYGVMTGSANATRQALCSNNNIEVSVLHLGKEAQQWVEWKRSKVPAVFEPAPPPSHDSSELLAHANLIGDVLQGNILGLADGAGRWDGVLTKPSGDTREFTTQVNEDGRFHVADLEFSQFGFSSGVQIILCRDSLRARGWVDSEDVLRVSRNPHLNLGSFIRIISRENTEDDDAALLQYLAIHAQKHLRPFVGRIKAVHKSRGEASETPVMEIDIDEIAPTAAPSGTGNGQGDLSAQSLDRVISQLRKSLLGHGVQRGRSITDQSVEEPEADTTDPNKAAVEFEREDGKRASVATKLERSIDLFDRKMRALVQTPELQSADLRGVLVLWFEVSMSMLLLRQKDQPRALRFAGAWVHTVAAKAHSLSDIDSLEQHFVTSIALLATKCARSPQELHELLESFYLGDVHTDRLNSALLPASGVPFCLFDCQGDEIFYGALSEILRSTTLRQELVSVIKATIRGEDINADSPVFKGQAGQIILSELKRASGTNRFVEQRGDDPVCAKSSETLPKIMASSLQNCRIAYHKGWFTVRTER